MLAPPPHPDVMVELWFCPLPPDDKAPHGRQVRRQRQRGWGWGTLKWPDCKLTSWFLKANALSSHQSVLPLHEAFEDNFWLPHSTSFAK